MLDGYFPMIRTNKRIVLRIVFQIDHENFTWNDRDEKIDTVESDVAE